MKSSAWSNAVKNSALFESLNNSAWLEILKIIPRGLSQVMLQNNALTGLLFLIGIFYNSWLMGLGALAGAITSTLAAFSFKFNKKDIYDGLYGFNGALVGIALLFFFKPSLVLFAILIFGSAVSSLVMNSMHKRKLMPLTFPFVITTWALILLVKILQFSQLSVHGLTEATGLNILSSASMGFGQVMFQASIVTGIVFFLAILVNSRVAAIYALAGSLFGMLLSFALSFPLNLVNSGIFGFNAVLCGIAFAGKDKKSVIYALVSVILSVFIIYGMQYIGIIALTSPFVFVAWITYGIKKLAVSALKK